MSIQRFPFFKIHLQFSFIFYILARSHKLKRQKRFMEYPGTISILISSISKSRAIYKSKSRLVSPLNAIFFNGLFQKKQHWNITVISFYLVLDVFFAFFFLEAAGVARRDFNFFLLTSVRSWSNDDLLATILAFFEPVCMFLENNLVWVFECFW